MELMIDERHLIVIGMAMLVTTGFVGIIKEEVKGKLPTYQYAIILILMLSGIASAAIGVGLLIKKNNDKQESQQAVRVENLNEWSVLYNQLHECDYRQCDEAVVRNFLKNNPDLTLSLDDLNLFHANHGDVVADLLVPFTVIEQVSTFDPETYYKEFLESKTPEERREYALELLGEMRKDAYGD